MEGDFFFIPHWQIFLKTVIKMFGYTKYELERVFYAPDGGGLFACAKWGL